eukprot:756804-Hanusia_phi.AAC.1
MTTPLTPLRREASLHDHPPMIFPSEIGSNRGGGWSDGQLHFLASAQGSSGGRVVGEGSNWRGRSISVCWGGGCLYHRCGQSGIRGAIRMWLQRKLGVLVPDAKRNTGGGDLT